MDRHQGVSTCRGTHEIGTEPWLELVQPPPQCEESRVDRGIGSIVAKESGLDEVSCRCGFGALGQEEHDGGLLLRQPNLLVVELDTAPGGIELDASKAVAAGTAGATLHKPGRQVGVDMRHRHVA